MKDRPVRANNIQALRLAFRLTPSELAALMRAEADDILRIEQPDYQLTDEWVRSAARALGIDEEEVTREGVDADEVRAGSTGLAAAPAVCPIAVRFAVLALIAKFGGVRLSARVAPDELGRLIQNVYAFVEGETGRAETQLSRLRPGLQIAVLAFLQSRDFVPGPNFQRNLEQALEGSLQMIDRFSAVGRQK